MHSPDRETRDRMPAPKKPKTVNKAELEAVELVPDAWPKFEKLVKSAAKMGPKPHQPKMK